MGDLKSSAVEKEEEDSGRSTGIGENKSRADGNYRGVNRRTAITEGRRQNNKRDKSVGRGEQVLN